MHGDAIDRTGIYGSGGDELVDAPEVAARLGLRNSRAVLDLRVHRLGFPAPVGRQGRSLLWSWSQVERWSVDSPAGRDLVSFA
jgi:predicted DNA-binding transcriptional regulator AlpA